MKPRCWAYSRKPRVSRGVQRVRARHRGGEVVDDEVTGNAVEERPRGLQPSDHILQLLAVGGPDEAVSGVGQHHDQRPHRPAAARLRIEYPPQPTEVQFRHLSRRALLHPDRRTTAPLPVAPLDEAPQRRVGNPAALSLQQLLDARQLQTVDGEPLVYLLGPGNELAVNRPRRPPGTGTPDRRQPAVLLLGGGWAALAHASLQCRVHILANRLAGQSRSRCYVPLTAPSLPAPDNLRYVHSGHLLVSHRRSSL